MTQLTSNEALFSETELRAVESLGYRRESHAAIIASVLGEVTAVDALRLLGGSGRGVAVAEGWL